MKAGNIDIGFNKALEALANHFSKKVNESAFYVRFDDQKAQLYFYSKPNEVKPLQFTQLISSRLIGLRYSVEKVYMALHWLKEVNKRRFGVVKDSDLSFLIFSSDQKQIALIGVNILSKHIVSYRFSEVLEQFDLKQEHLN